MITVSVASGTPQNLTVGPYDLSFDHETEILGPIYGVTWEGFNRTDYEADRTKTHQYRSVLVPPGLIPALRTWLDDGTNGSRWLFPGRNPG